MPKCVVCSHARLTARKRIIPSKWHDRLPNKYKQSQDFLFICEKCYIKYSKSLRLSPKFQRQSHWEETDFWGLIIECRWHFFNTMSPRNLPPCWSVYLCEEPNGTEISKNKRR